MKSTQNTAEAPSAKLSATISLSINSRYSISNVYLVQEALMIHRDTCMNLFLESLKEGSYSNAYGYYTSFQDINQVLDEMLIKVTDLAENNYLAEQYARNPGAYCPTETSDSNRENRYQSWLKEILPEGQRDEPEDAELTPIPADKLNDFGLYPADGTFLLDMRDAGATDQEIKRFAELLTKRNTTPAEQ